MKTDSKTVSFSLVLVLLLSVIWGLAFVAIRRAVFELTPVNLTLTRWLITSGAFLILAPIIGRPKTRIQKGDIPRLLVVSLASVGGYHLSLNYAETIVSSGLAGLLISFAPVFAVLLSALLLKEKIGMKLLLALALAISGALILSFANPSPGFQHLTGPLAVILAAFMYGVFSVASKPLVAKYGAFPTAIWAAVLGTAMLLPLLSRELLTELSSLSTAGWLSVLYLAIISTVIANSIFYTLVSTRAISTLSVQLYLVPLVSVIGGAILLSEAVTIFTLVGGALLLTAVAVATRRKR